MSTDDRDTESANPSKSFKVGEVDRLSGFFTPVWESKRRLRSESPVPSSSAAASAPSSARGANSDKPAASRPSVPPPAPSRRSSPPPAKADAVRPPRPAGPTRAVARTAPEHEPEPAPSEASASPSAPGELDVAASFAATPLAPPAARADGGGAAEPLTSGPAVGVPASSDEGAEPMDGAAAAAGAAPDPRFADALAAAAAVTMRPVIPMPDTPGRAPQRSKPPSTPGPADDASERAAPPHEAPVAREPAHRSPPPAARGPLPVGLRSARAAAAATAMHERFVKGRLQTDSADTFARHRETESEREAAMAAAARAAAAPADPYPSHVLRSLRRTIHLSTPLPEPVRQMIEKYRY